MIYTKLTSKAMLLAYEKHQGQFDKSGIPYIFHPFHLAEQMDDEYSTVVALLHDTLEDTDTTAEELLNLGFPNEVVDTIKLLTRPEGMDYLDYVQNLKNNSIAKKVKIADLTHNMDLTRIENVTPKDLQRIEKYKKAMSILNND